MAFSPGMVIRMTASQATLADGGTQLALDFSMSKTRNKAKGGRGKPTATRAAKGKAASPNQE